jgi:4a-hydroxytetrahydrobiopterin dehydratase
MPVPTPAPEIARWLSDHPAWSLEGARLTRTFEASTFVKAIAFVDQVATIAESLDHHPDIDIRWRRVTLRLLTHDAGDRVTEDDLRLAAECDLLFGEGI